MTWLVAVHLAATAAMAGFAWTIQVLHYPMLAATPADVFGPLERLHQRRVVAVLAALAPVEIVAAGWLVLEDPSNLTSWAGGVLLAAIWVSTGLFYAPIHGRLSAGHDHTLLDRLVRWNWARTAAWTIRAVLAVLLAV